MNIIIGGIKMTNKLLERENVNVVKIKTHSEIINDMHEHNPVNEHVYSQAIKHSLDYFDLLNASLCVEYKYKGKFSKEKIFADAVIESTDKLWHEAYYCALYMKKQWMDRWKYHIPRLKDLGINEPSDEEFGEDYANWNYWRNKELEDKLIIDRKEHFNNMSAQITKNTKEDY